VDRVHPLWRKWNLPRFALVVSRKHSTIRGRCLRAWKLKEHTVKTRWNVTSALIALGAMILTACAPVVGGPTEMTVYVGPYLVDCVGVSPQKCMLVRQDPKADWTLFYDQIAGFDYEGGFDYVLLVREEETENPPADASSLRWTLVDVVQKTRSLEGTRWTLESYLTSESELADVLPGAEITARFQEGQVVGSAGCNSYFGSYEVEGDSLAIGAIGSTEMYCGPEEVMDQEGAYLSALGSASSFSIAGDQLHLVWASGDTVLTFSVLQPAPLVGTPWKLVSFYDGVGGVVSVLAGTEIRAFFGQDGSLGGSAGCNNYTSSYTVDGNQMSMGPVASTMMMCPGPEGIMEQEATYFGALESVAGYQIEGNALRMADAHGQTVLSYAVLEPAPLVDTPWLLLRYNNGKQAMVSSLAGTEITALFGIDATLSGSAGCNNYNAPYEVDGNKITISPAATTRKMCAEPEGTMEQEAAYLAALGSAAAYEVVGDRLELVDSSGTRVATYEAQADADTGDDVGAEDPALVEALRNAEYKSEWTKSRMVQLAGGEYREQAAPGSATETVVMLTDQIAVGELNGQPAAAVILVTDPGGSGTFYDLAVVVEQDGQLVNVATTTLGDRVQVNSLSIENGQIVVDLVTHGQDDPMCCPTKQVSQTYELQGDQLLKTSET
jgi:heat shock protein HslJ